MSQIALLFTGAGLAVAVLGGAVGFVLSALIGNGVALGCNPGQFPVAGALVRQALRAICLLHCPVRHPAGILLTGYLGPFTAQSFGWRDTMLASAALCWAVALMLQPLRGRLDTELSARHPDPPVGFAHHDHCSAGGPLAALVVIRLLCVQRHTGRFCCRYSSPT